MCLYKHRSSLTGVRRVPHLIRALEGFFRQRSKKGFRLRLLHSMPLKCNMNKREEKRVHVLELIWKNEQLHSSATDAVQQIRNCLIHVWRTEIVFWVYSSAVVDTNWSTRGQLFRECKCVTCSTFHLLYFIKRMLTKTRYWLGHKNREKLFIFPSRTWQPFCEWIEE